MLAARKGKVVPMNIDGATAVIYTELGFPPPLSRGIFCLSRSVGILAHACGNRQAGMSATRAQCRGNFRTDIPAQTSAIWSLSYEPVSAAAVCGDYRFAEMPKEFRKPAITEWSRANKQGLPVDCFLEGLCLDPEGNCFVVDIPHGRIFSISSAGIWRLVAAYDGEPNGLARHADGRIFIADYKNGILALDPLSGTVVPVLTRRNGERFKGPNDLIFARNGDLYFTDQGQTGLHDPSGRVYRLTAAAGLIVCLITDQARMGSYSQPMKMCCSSP